MLLSEVFSLFRGRDRLIAGSLVALSLLGALLEMAGVALVMPFISLLSQPDLLTTRESFRRLGEFLGGGGHSAVLVRLGVVLVLFFLGKNVLLGVSVFFQNSFLYRKMREVAHRLFLAYLRAPYLYHLSRNTAELQRNINSDVPVMFNWVVVHTFVLVGDVFVVTVVTALLFTVDALACAAVLALFLLVAVVFFRLFHGRTEQFGQMEQAAFGRMIRWVTQGLGGAKETRVLGLAPFFLSEFDRSNLEYARARRRVLTLNEVPRLLFETVAVGGILAIVLLALSRGREAREVLPVAAVFAAAAFRLMPAMSRIVRSLNLIRHFRPSLRVVLRDLGELRSIEEEPAPEGGPPVPLEHAVALEDVWFSYPGREEPVLAGVTARVTKGSIVGFVGASGAGKTTLVDLMLGLIPPSRGRVTVDGQDIAGRLATWRRSCGYIPQSIHLLDDSVRRNVALGIPDEGIDDDAVWRALGAARLEEFVRGLPAGLATVIGEGGARLSGGQRQRIGIARALYRDPAVLVLDEATSALDAETERGIAETIHSMRGARTVVVIAHRLTTVRRCDRLFFLDRGRVAAEGTFEALVAASEDFRRMAQVAAEPPTGGGEA